MHLLVQPASEIGVMLYGYIKLMHVFNLKYPNTLEKGQTQHAKLIINKAQVLLEKNRGPLYGSSQHQAKKPRVSKINLKPTAISLIIKE